MSGSVLTAALTTSSATPTLIPGLPVVTGPGAVSFLGQVVLLNPATGSVGLWNVAALVSAASGAAPAYVTPPSVAPLNVLPPDLAPAELVHTMTPTGAGLVAIGKAGLSLQWAATLLVTRISG